MTELTARQQELLDELLKDFKGDAREIFGEGASLLIHDRSVYN